MLTQSRRQHGERRTIRAGRVRSVTAWLACAAMVGGCVHGPRRADGPAPTSPSPSQPAAAGESVPTVSVDLNRTVGENTTFHKSATDRQRFQVHIDFGKVFESQGDMERAAQEYQAAVELAEGRGHRKYTSADAALAHRRLASVLDRLGQFGQSEPHYRTAQKLAAKDPRVWNDSGYSYYLQGRWDDAERGAPDGAEARAGRSEGSHQPRHGPGGRRQDQGGSPPAEQQPG